MQWCSNQNPLRITRWIIGTGQVNSGYAAVLAWQCAFRKQSHLFEGLFYLYLVFLMYPFFFKRVHYYVDKPEFCQHVEFSQNCCFVTNFVDKALVSTALNLSGTWLSHGIYRVSVAVLGSSGCGVSVPQRQFFAKLSGTWLSRGSFRVSMAVWVLCGCYGVCVLFFFTKIVLHGSSGTDLGEGATDISHGCSQNGPLVISHCETES